MFELADRLVGIYKTYNCTKTVTINPGKIASAASATASDNLHAAHAAAAAGVGTGNTQANAGTQEPTQKKRHLATSASASGAALQDQAAAKNAKVAATAAEWSILRMIRLWKIINTYRFIIRPVLDWIFVLAHLIFGLDSICII